MLTGLVPQDENALPRMLMLELDGIPKDIRNPMSPGNALRKSKQQTSSANTGKNIPSPRRNPMRFFRNDGFNTFFAVNTILSFPSQPTILYATEEIQVEKSSKIREML